MQMFNNVVVVLIFLNLRQKHTTVAVNNFKKEPKITQYKSIYKWCNLVQVDHEQGN